MDCAKLRGNNYFYRQPNIVNIVLLGKYSGI